MSTRKNGGRPKGGRSKGGRPKGGRPKGGPPEPPQNDPESTNKNIQIQHQDMQSLVCLLQNIKKM